jgi:hypothetical protein
MGASESTEFKNEQDILQSLFDSYKELNQFEKLASKALVGHCHHKRETEKVIADVATAATH